MNLLKLRGVCVEKNINRDELAFMWRCTPQTVSKKLHGKSPITFEEAKVFSKEAGLTDEEKVNIFLSEG